MTGLKAGDLVVNSLYKGVVYLVCNLSPSVANKEWELQLVKIIDRRGEVPMVTSIDLGTRWHTSDALIDGGFRKIGHLDLSNLRVNTNEKS